MNKNIEDKIKRIILPDLINGRSDFDLNHTKAVVYWMKKILKSVPHIDPNIMIVSAYAHDWGYVGLFTNVDSTNMNEINKKKAFHMEIGAKKIKELLLQSFSANFSSTQINTISHLVGIHDKIEHLKTEEELTLMEADTLGMLDVSRVKPTFTKVDNAKFIQTQIYQRRLPKFIHKNVKKIAELLTKERVNYYLQVAPFSA